MIITREFESPNGTWETWGACDGTVCRYDEGDYWPLGGDRLWIGNAPNAREEQWISLEFEANVVTGMIKLYVDTLDRQLSGRYIERRNEWRRGPPHGRARAGRASTPPPPLTTALHRATFSGWRSQVESRTRAPSSGKAGKQRTKLTSSSLRCFHSS